MPSPYQRCWWHTRAPGVDFQSRPTTTTWRGFLPTHNPVPPRSVVPRSGCVHFEMVKIPPVQPPLVQAAKPPHIVCLYKLFDATHMPLCARGTAAPQNSGEPCQHMEAPQASCLPACSTRVAELLQIQIMHNAICTQPPAPSSPLQPTRQQNSTRSRRQVPLDPSHQPQPQSAPISSGTKASD
jgi:hypothetical protein